MGLSKGQLHSRQRNLTVDPQAKYALLEQPFWPPLITFSTYLKKKKFIKFFYCSLRHFTKHSTIHLDNITSQKLSLTFEQCLLMLHEMRQFSWCVNEKGLSY